MLELFLAGHTRRASFSLSQRKRQKAKLERATTSRASGLPFNRKDKHLTYSVKADLDGRIRCRDNVWAKVMKLRFEVEATTSRLPPNQETAKKMTRMWYIDDFARSTNGGDSLVFVQNHVEPFKDEYGFKDMM